MSSTSAPLYQKCHLGGEDVAVEDEQKEELCIRQRAELQIIVRMGRGESCLTLKHMVMAPAFYQFCLFVVLILLIPFLLSSIPFGSWSSTSFQAHHLPLSSATSHLTQCFFEPQQDTLSWPVSKDKAKAQCVIPVPGVAWAPQDVRARRTCFRSVLFQTLSGN